MMTTRLHTMDKSLRLALLSTALLVVPGIGQLLAVHDLNTTGQYGNLTVFLLFLAIFAVPTAAILSGVLLGLHRRTWREHERTLTLAVLNLLLALNLAWFFFHQCSWAQVFGLGLRTCS